jgi:ABC-2 type transport system permease protein
MSIGIRQIVALAVKDIRLMLRDKAGFFFVFCFPLIYCIFFGVMMGGMMDGKGSALKIALVDEDGSEESQEFAGALRQAPELAVQIPQEGDNPVELVRLQKVTAFVRIPKGFGEAQRRMFWGDPLRLEVGVDPSRVAESGLLRGVLTKYAFAGMSEFFSEPQKMAPRIDEWMADINAAEDMDPMMRGTLQVFLPALRHFMSNMPEPATHPAEADAAKEGDEPVDALSMGGWEPVRIEMTSIARKRDGPKNPYEITFPQGIVWGVMGCAAGFGISMVVERTRGTLMRLRTAPVSRAQILSGKALVCFFTTLTVSIVLLAIGVLGFRIRIGSPWLLALALPCVSVCFVGIMMLLSVLGKTEQSAGGIGWAILTIMAMIGGGMIPLFVMPAFMQKVSHISPIKWSIVVLDGAVWRGYTPAQMLTPCAILLAIGVGCFLIGVRAFRWTD